MQVTGVNCLPGNTRGTIDPRCGLAYQTQYGIRVPRLNVFLLNNDLTLFDASFKLYPDKENRLVVPFSQFYATFRMREPIPLEAIDSFFITVNTSNSQTGFSSRITIQEIGFCQK